MRRRSVGADGRLVVWTRLAQNDVGNHRPCPNAAAASRLSMLRCVSIARRCALWSARRGASKGDGGRRDKRRVSFGVAAGLELWGGFAAQRAGPAGATKSGRRSEPRDTASRGTPPTEGRGQPRGAASRGTPPTEGRGQPKGAASGGARRA